MLTNLHGSVFGQDETNRLKAFPHWNVSKEKGNFWLKVKKKMDEDIKWEPLIPQQLVLLFSILTNKTSNHLYQDILIGHHWLKKRKKKESQ